MMTSCTEINLLSLNKPIANRLYHCFTLLVAFQAVCSSIFLIEYNNQLRRIIKYYVAKVPHEQLNTQALTKEVERNVCEEAAAQRLLAEQRKVAMKKYKLVW